MHFISEFISTLISGLDSFLLLSLLFLSRSSSPSCFILSNCCSSSSRRSFSFCCRKSASSCSFCRRFCSSSSFFAAFKIFQFNYEFIDSCLFFVFKFKFVICLLVLVNHEVSRLISTRVLLFAFQTFNKHKNSYNIT